jgi:hypothetical protein
MEHIETVLGAALAILTALALVVRRLTQLSHAITSPGVNGKREPRLQALEDGVSRNAATLASHGKMHRKSFAAIATLRKGQEEILEFLTEGKKSSVRPIADDIDAENTGRHAALTGE